MLSVSWLLSLILAAANSNLLPALKDVSNYNRGPDVAAKLKLVNDVIGSREEDDVVIIAHIDDLVELSETYAASAVKLQLSDVTNQTLEDLQILYIKDNKLGLYIVLPSITDTDEEVKDLILNIQGFDFNARVAVFYEDTVDVKALYKDQKIYNIYVFNPDYAFAQDSFATDRTEKIIYKMYTVCRYCADGDDRFDIANRWTFNTGFKDPLLFKLSFTGNFYKNQGTMGVDWYYPPNFYIIQDEDGNDILWGSSYRNYKNIGNVMNMTWNFVTADVTPWLFVPYVADLNEGKIEVIGSGWVGRYDRYLLAGDMSYPYHVGDGTSIISIEPLKGVSPDAVYTALDYYVWLFLFLSIPICGLVLFIARSYDRNPDKPANLFESCWELGIIICFESGIAVRKAPWSIMFIFGTYMIMAFITITEYINMITAIIAIPQMQSPPIDKLEQLWETDRKWVSDWPTNKALFMKYFENVENIEGRYYYPDVESEYGNPTLKALDYVLQTEGQVVYFSNEGSIKAELDRSGLGSDSDRKFYYSKQKFKPGLSVLYRKKSLYYKEYLNRAIMLCTAWGIINMQGRDFSRLDTIKARLTEKIPPRDLGLIELKHSLTAVMIISGVGVLGILTFFIELIYYHTKKRTFQSRAKSFVLKRKALKALWPTNLEKARLA